MFGSGKLWTGMSAHKGPAPPHNLEFKPLPVLSWEPEQQVASLKEIADYVAGEAQRAIDWYLWKKDGKRFWARSLRLAAILLAAMAGIIPLLAQLHLSETDRLIEPAWASVALVMAAAAIVLDRLFGCSSAWMRFITSELQIRRALHEFRLDWEMWRAIFAGREPGPAEVQVMLMLCKAFIDRIDDIIAQETSTWIQEFSAALQETAMVAKVQAEIRRTEGTNMAH